MMNTFTVARTFGIALLLFFASAVCHAGALPDLNGQLNGLEQAIKGTPCFDPQQPWYVCFVIGNVHTTGSDPVKGAAGPFNLTLEIMKGPGLSSGVFNTVSKNVPEGIGAGNLLEVCFQLPKKFDHNDLGTKHAFRLTIDSPLPKGIVAEDNENNNVVEFGDGTAVPLAPDSSLPQAPAPDKNLKIIDTAAFPNDQHNLNVRVKNLGAIDSKMMVMFLVVRSGGFGATGAKDDLNGIKVPSIPPGKSIWVKIGSANEAFIKPTPKATDTPSEKANQPLLSKASVGDKIIVANVKKGFGSHQAKTNPTVVAMIAPPPDYKVLIPFTLEISGTHEKLSFGGPSLPSGGGVIKIPGKK